MLMDIYQFLFGYESVTELLDKVESYIYFFGIIINYRNVNLRFLFVLLFVFQAFDSYVLSKQMAIIKPFYMEHLVESMFAILACSLILGRAKIAGWVRYDSRYLGYMQEFGLFAVYVGFSIYSLVLFIEGVLYWHTELIPNPLPIFSNRLYFYYTLEVLEIWILISLTLQNLLGKLPVRHSVDI